MHIICVDKRVRVSESAFSQGQLRHARDMLTKHLASFTLPIDYEAANRRRVDFAEYRLVCNSSHVTPRNGNGDVEVLIAVSTLDNKNHLDSLYIGLNIAGPADRVAQHLAVEIRRLVEE